jgi:Protein of unknown function (DUF1706)
MSDKERLLREADEAFAELRRAIEGLTDDEMRQVWFGSWGVREILIHISGWHEAMAPALGHIARDEAPSPAGTYEDFDAWNARFVLRKTGVKTDEVLAELDASHAGFVAAARAVPDQHFEAGSAARETFENNGAGHYREHAAQIREWRRAAHDRLDASTTDATRI